MRFRKIDESPKTFILVFEIGDEFAEGLLWFAKEQKLSAASFKAVGALSSVRLGWFSWESKRRRLISLRSRSVRPGMRSHDS
jgi:predicted DNA-binding protein with PD1-like motif